MKRCKFMRLAAWVLTLMTISAAAGCTTMIHFSDQDMDVYEKIHQKYRNMTSYTADVNLTVKSNKTENVYQIRQSVQEGDLYRTEVLAPDNLAGLVTVRCGDSVQSSMDKFGESAVFPASSDLDYLFVNQFFSLYYKSQDTYIDVSALKDAGSTVLETELPASSAHRQRVSLRIDNKTLEPLNITVFDMGGEAVLTAEFSEFQYNPKLDEALFSVSAEPAV